MDKEKRQLRPTSTSAPLRGVRPEREVSTILDQIFKRGNKYPGRSSTGATHPESSAGSESIVTHFQFNLVYSSYAVAFALRHKILSSLQCRGEGHRLSTPVATIARTGNPKADVSPRTG
jgi:hypothetical protein